MTPAKFCLALFCLSCTSLNSNAQEFGGNPSFLKWKQINTPHTRVIYPRGLDSQANRISFINGALGKTTAYSIGGKQRKWNIVLLNQTTIPNAYVRMAPLLSEFYMTPGQDNFNNGSLRWDDNLVIHENRHIQQLSNFNNGLTKVFSFLLGQEGQLLANGITIPDYFFEGDAVFQETLVSEQGRGRLPAFFNGMKSLWISNKKYSWMKLRSGSLVDYTPSHYELGYQLVAYGYEKYGTDFWRKVTEDAVRFKGLFYAFNKAIEKHTGVGYPTFREDAMRYYRQLSLPDTTTQLQDISYISPIADNNVIDYVLPNFVSDDTLVVAKRSYRQVPAFYLLVNGHESQIRVRDQVIDDYYSYRNGKIVYAGFQSHPRWGNSNYSLIQLLDIHTGEQRQLGTRTKYFSPDINEAGDEVLAVQVNENGTNKLHRINAANGALLHEVPNADNYFFTYPKFVDSNTAIVAARSPAGQMALLKVNLANGAHTNLTPFSFNVIGYPFVRGDTVFFTGMNQTADKIFAVEMSTKKIHRLTSNQNGVYQPAYNKGTVLLTAFTADGARLAKKILNPTDWKELSPEDFESPPAAFNQASLLEKGSGLLKQPVDTSIVATEYKKTFQLFNFHSWRPEVNDPEYSYWLYGDNVLSTSSTTAGYTFNRADRSSTLGLYQAFASWFPVLNAGGEYSFNRNLDTAVGKTVNFNSAKLNAGIRVPLQWVGRRTSKYLTIGGGYNIEQLYYNGIGKNVLDNRSLKYTNWVLAFSNISQRARQHINPRWAQQLNLSLRDAFAPVNSYKMVVNSSFFFPGLFPNHSLVINASYQQRDTSFNFFSNTFSYSRGYEALSTRRMYKWGANYHFPLFYPDWGFGNIFFLQRVRANAFFDFTAARARVNGILTTINNRSTGTEIYLDGVVWNALPISFGVRFSRLLDRDLQNPGVKNYVEFILPIGLIPN